MRLIDVGERCLQFQEPVGRQECPGVGDGDAVLARAKAEWEPEWGQPLIHGEGEELSDDIPQSRLLRHDGDWPLPHRVACTLEHSTSSW
jgi:hypothetical protein